MKHLPPSIGNLTKLEYLDLSNNELEELPPEIGRLVNLKQLYLQRNNLRSLPDSIVNIVNLEHQWDVSSYYLDISRNHICSLPPAVSRWVDTMLSADNSLGPEDSGAWKNTQCNDCPKGEINCDVSIKGQRKRPPGPIRPGFGTKIELFDLKGNKMKSFETVPSNFLLPKGCYIMRYGGTVFRYKRYVVP